MGFIDGLFRGLQEFAESDTAKRMMERVEQKQAEEIARTTGRNGLRCILDTVDDYGYMVRCEGSVKNVGRSTYKNIAVDIAFKNENGRVVDKTSDFVCYGTTLAPGESVHFTSTSTAKNIYSASASIRDFQER